MFFCWFFVCLGVVVLDLSKRGLQIDGCLNLGQSGLQVVQQSNSYSKYNFYVDFADGMGKDKVSGTLMQTTLEEGRVNADGSYLGEDVPAIQDGKLNTLGGITEFGGYSTDSDNWVIGNNVTLTTSDECPTDSALITSSTLYSLLEASNRIVSTNIITGDANGKTFTYSFWVKSFVDTSIFIETRSDAGVVYSFFFPSVLVSDGWKRLSVTYTFQATTTLYYFRLYDSSNQTGNLFYITGINMIESSYLMPYIHNNTGGPITIPHGYSDANEGYKWPIASCPKLITALCGTDGTDAQGTLIVEWEPQFSTADITTTQNILTSNDGTDWILSYDGANQQLTATDGTNTAVVACTPVAGTLMTIKLLYGDNSGNKMQLVCDSTDGTAVTFAGSFQYEDGFSGGWDSTSDNWQQIKSIKILEANPWD